MIYLENSLSFILLSGCFMNKSVSLAFIVSSFLLSACTSGVVNSVSAACSSEISSAQQELDIAKAQGYERTVNYGRAVDLLSEAESARANGEPSRCAERAKYSRSLIKLAHTGR